MSDEHVYCVAVTFKMTEQVEQQTCITFCVKLERSSTETVWMTQKAAAMRTGDWRLHHCNVPTHASRLMQFFGKTSNHPDDSAPLQPRFGALQLLAFPQTKVNCESKEISDH